jgi:hypothetical protein
LCKLWRHRPQCWECTRNNFWLQGLSVLVMIPFVFLMKHPSKGVSSAAH